MIHDRRGELAELVAVLARAAESSSGERDELELRVRIAQLETRRAVGDAGDAGAAAIAAWQAAHDLDPSDARPLDALEALHRERRDWVAVQDVISRRLSAATSASERLALLTQLADIDERERAAPDDAIGHHFAALDAAPGHRPAFDALERLLTAGGRHHDVVELLSRRAEVEAAAGDHDAELRALMRTADVWEGPLDDPAAAGEVLEKVLTRDPRAVAALTRLSRLQARAGDWEKCSATLQQALGLGPTGRDAADLFFRLAEVAREGTGDLDTARAHLEQALKHDPGHAGALAALEALARDRGDHGALAELLRQRLAATSTEAAPGARQALVLELAELERGLGRPAAALPLLEEAVAAAPTDPKVLGPLADLYVAANRRADAAPLYQRLADEARAARRMKDVARYRQRQGALLEVEGDATAAAAAYDEAFRINPTDSLTMAGLGRLAMAARDWEKARKVYRSLVLQNIDADAGITKGEVYLALGEIHLALDEAPKARGMFQRGLEVEPGHPRLVEALGRLGKS
ncbi:MAG: tetratricopeptide repeat protein [Kofleriaceae bacterium]